ncbi:MAG TPA: carboxypeptidase-like regulatory domain-containing protein [Chryseolinea sp.]|nr:carboxypeptidase-like regulatory domain-containing protein [Chryseolinea sp.]HPH46535.1 carboxypeptidase-like regulatory domain-containing protein [Chryseolinea sp.]HPM29518.1 carboxypeptidase-like regulatory domain-containing protein [Chryseolinea sp.]
MKSSRLHIIALFIITISVFGSIQTAFAQQNKRVIQLSGVVLGQLDSDSVIQLPGVHIYLPKAGRGQTTNPMGFFSMPVLVGDELVISSVGYQKQKYVVPENAIEYQTIIITLSQDTTFLDDVIVFPFPTEEVFKQAVLALNIPLEDGQIDPRNLNAELMALMMKSTPMDGYQNQRYYLNQWASSQTSRYQPVTNPFLNPFNWAKFFNGLKKDKKK